MVMIAQAGDGSHQGHLRKKVKVIKAYCVGQQACGALEKRKIDHKGPYRRARVG